MHCDVRTRKSASARVQVGVVSAPPVAFMEVAAVWTRNCQIQQKYELVQDWTCGQNSHVDFGDLWPSCLRVLFPAANGARVRGCRTSPLV